MEAKVYIQLIQLRPEGFPSPYLRVAPAPLQIQPAQTLLVRDLSGGDRSTMTFYLWAPSVHRGAQTLHLIWSFPEPCEVDIACLFYCWENGGSQKSSHIPEGKPWANNEFLVFSFQEMLFSVLGVDNCLIVTFFCYSTWALLSHSAMVAMTNSSVV